MAMLEIRGVRKSFHTYAKPGVRPGIFGRAPKPVSSLDVLRGVDLTVEKGDVVAILGPSGSGKTTLLRCLNFLETADAGTLTFDGEAFDLARADRASIARLRRKTAFVFQNYNLFRNKTALQNVTEGLIVARKMPKNEANAIGMKMLEKVGLADRADYYPRQLSGGQQQRVAIARAIVSEPRLLLLDEPLSNLDAKLRVDMRAELKRLHHETGTTIIYVTHDQVEALTMSTRIALYRKGELVQVAPPLELYDNPVNLYTADFIGNPSINFVKGTAQVEAGGMRVDSPLGQLGFERGDMTEAAPQSGSVDVTIGVRPEQLSISRQADDAHWVEGRVYSGMPAGSETLVSVRVGDTMLTVKELGSTHYASDEPVYLGFNPKKVNVFETKSENLIKYCV